MPSNTPQSTPTLYALLIAINDYHPKSGVSSLAGCVNDIESVKKFLRKQYRDLKPKIRVLKNEKATRKGVIRAFRSHLVKKAKAGDTVLLYYAGHGSHTRTAPEFEAFDAKKQDETFVCYDSRMPGNHDLTDKEIAVLLSEIEDKVHTVVIADSCHSASVTRGEPKEDKAAALQLAAKRYTAGTTTKRNIESYLLGKKNYYTQLTEKINVPRSKHLLLSACSRDEEAWETYDRRGLFSTTLLQVLGDNPHLSYNEVFARVRSRVYGTAKNQMPTIYPHEGFNPNSVFLRADVKPNPLRHQLKIVGNDWRIEYGAIHGLQVASEDLHKLVIGVFEDDKDSKKQVAVCEVEKILLKETVLKNTEKLDKNKSYFGEVQSYPAALLIDVEGSKQERTSFKDLYEPIEKDFPFIRVEEGLKNSKYFLKVADNQLGIYLRADKKFIHGIKEVDSVTVRYIAEILTDIANWERIQELQNKETTFKENAVEACFIKESEEEEPVTYTDEVITLDYPKQGADKDEDEDPVAIYYTIKARNNSNQKLYISLIQMGANFEVANHFKCEAFPKRSDWVTLDDQHGLAILNQNLNETTDIFKIIISTEDFDDYKFNQDGFQVGEYITKDQIERTRSTITRKTSRKKADWFTKTITVNTVRKVEEVGKTEAKLMGITFESHPSFKANLSLAPAKSITRSARPGKALADMFNEGQVELINLVPKGARSTRQDQSIIEMSDLKNADSLKDHPLTIKVSADLGTGGKILPVTMQNGFVIPLGESIEQADGSTKIEISQIPDGIDAPPAKKGTRSLGRALWFSLLKVVGMEQEVFQLRKVDFSGGKDDLRVAVHKDEVKKAKKILLITHGIIGDTKTMLPNLEFLLSEKRYDLLLTFDYENLNTKIEDIAGQLDKKLAALGLTAGHGKTFDILAHSMGGLASRYLIENLHENEQLVDQLFMFGTPNGGSVFGEIPALRDRLTQLMTIALNFGKGWTGWVHTVLSLTNKALISTKYLTKTLAQMSPKSGFVKKLKGGKNVSTKYTVIAGDISDFQSIKEARLAKLIEILLLKIGQAANAEPNDIAVKVKDIRAIPETIAALKYDVCCHHLNYFEIGAGLDMLKEVMQEKVS